MPEAGLKELQAKASALGCTCRSPVDSLTVLVEKTLSELRVSFTTEHCFMYNRFHWSFDCTGQLSHVCGSAGAAQTCALQKGGAEPLSDSCGEHLDPRASEETWTDTSAARAPQGATLCRNHFTNHLDRRCSRNMPDLPKPTDHRRKQQQPERERWEQKHACRQVG